MAMEFKHYVMSLDDGGFAVRERDGIQHTFAVCDLEEDAIEIAERFAVAEDDEEGYVERIIKLEKEVARLTKENEALANKKAARRGRNKAA